MPDPHTKQDLLSTITTINTYHEQDHETNQILKAHQQKFMWLHDIPLTLQVVPTYEKASKHYISDPNKM